MMVAMDESSGPPPAPTAPDPGECCGEGCSNCVFDLHDAAMQRWRLQLAAWEARRSAGTQAGTGPAESGQERTRIQNG
jgi:hypothetical protein